MSHLPIYLQIPHHYANHPETPNYCAVWMAWFTEWKSKPWMLVKRETTLLLTSMSCCWLGQSREQDAANSPLQTTYSEWSTAAASSEHSDSTASIVVFVLPVKSNKHKVSVNLCSTITQNSFKHCPQKQANHFQTQFKWPGSLNEFNNVRQVPNRHISSLIIFLSSTSQNREKFRLQNNSANKCIKSQPLPIHLCKALSVSINYFLTNQITKKVADQFCETPWKGRPMYVNPVK